MAEIKFSTALNCMDGRVQDQTSKWIKDNYNVDFVDMINEPGINKILADEKNSDMHKWILQKIDISLDIHESESIFIVAHDDCAGNPTDKKQQIKDLHNSSLRLRKLGITAPIELLWINKEWEIEKL